MNHKKASPANGTRFNAKATRVELVVSHAPGSRGSLGTEIRSSPNTARSRTQNRMPAIAAAFGVFKFDRVMVFRESSLMCEDAHGLGAGECTRVRLWHGTENRYSVTLPCA